MSDRTRRIAAPAFATLAALTLLAAVVSGYARHTVFDSDSFANRATAALEDDAVRAEIATRVTDNLVLRAEADLVAVRPVIESVVDGLVGGSVFQSVFRSGVRDVHRSVFDRDANTVTLTLADIGAVLRGALVALRPQLAEQIPGGIDIPVTKIEPPAWLAEVARVGRPCAPARADPARDRSRARRGGAGGRGRHPPGGGPARGRGGDLRCRRGGRPSGRGRRWS